MLPKVCRIKHKNTLFAHYKLSKDWLDDILDIFFNYFNVIKAQSKFDLKGYKKKVRIKHEHFFMFARLKTL